MSLVFLPHSQIFPINTLTISPQLCFFLLPTTTPILFVPSPSPPYCRFNISVSIHVDPSPIYISPFLLLSTSLLNYTVRCYLLKFLKVINFPHFLSSFISRFRSLILYTVMSYLLPLPTCLLHPNPPTFLRTISSKSQAYPNIYLDPSHSIHGSSQTFVALKLSRECIALLAIPLDPKPRFYLLRGLCHVPTANKDKS